MIRKILAASATVLGVVGALVTGSVGHAAPSAAPQEAVVAPAAAVCTGYAAANPYVQTRAVRTNSATAYNSTAWTNLACGTTRVTLGRGRHALLVVHVDAEVLCTGPVGQWCQGRVLVGGVQGEPSAPEPDSFAWAHADPSLTSWEANSFTRSRFLTCPSSYPFPVCVWPIYTQVRTHSAGYVLRVDDSHVTAQLTIY